MKVRRDARTKLGEIRPKKLGGWEGAVADAEAQITATKARLSRLKAALAFCRERLASGDPFPGESKQKSKRGLGLGYGSAKEVLGQDGVLGQSRTIEP